MTAYDPRQWGARCDDCPIRYQGAKVVPPKWAASFNATSPIVLVVESPGLNEVKRGEFFAGAASVKLDEILYDVGISNSKVALKTGAILCRPEVPDAVGRKRFDLKNWLAWWRKENVARRRAAKDFAKQYPDQPLAESVRPLANPFDCCKPRLDAELLAAEKASVGSGCNLVVMPMGSFALGSVMGKPGKALSITKYRGSVLTPGPEGAKT